MAGESENIQQDIGKLNIEEMEEDKLKMAGESENIQQDIGKLNIEEIEGDKWKMAGVSERFQPGIGKPNIKVKGEDIADLEKISPSTEERPGALLRSISAVEVRIGQDVDGIPQTKYKTTTIKYLELSNSFAITEPKSDPDIETKVDACLELINYHLKPGNSKKPHHFGVLFDKTKISLSSEKQYKLEQDFELTKEILAKGNCAGDIVVLKDKKTDQKHACKTLMIQSFRKEEVKCWVDMSDSGCVPALYLLKIENNEVAMHMEILENAKSLSSIIKEHMGEIHDSAENRSLLKPISLYVLEGALGAVTELHKKGWVHQDLHADNIMVDKTGEEELRVKVLDFGSAGKLEDRNCSQGFLKDIAQVVRLFSALYTGGLELDAQYGPLNKDMKKKIKEQAEEMTKLNCDDKKELFCLVDAALDIQSPNQVEKYRQQVKTELGKAMGQSKKEIMRKVVAILFPEDFQPIHQDVMLDSAEALRDFDVADSKILSSHHDYMDHDLDFELKANQVTDEYVENLRMTLGIDIKKPKDNLGDTGK